MAAGSEPEYIRQLFAHVRHICSGYSLAGAGGGGFAVIILNENATLEQLQNEIESYRNRYNYQEILSIHSVRVNNAGIMVTTRPNNIENIESYVI